MSSQTEIPGTFTDYSVTSSISANGGAWSDASDAGTTGSSYAANEASGNSDSLQGTECGFSVSGTVDGVALSFSRYATNDSGTKNVEDEYVMLVFNPGTSPTLSSNNYAATSTKWPLSPASTTYGSGTTDTWGSASSLTASAVNGSDFGCLVSASVSETIVTGYVNSVSQTVYYTASGGGGGTPGQPSALAVTGTTTTSVSLSWTQGSGTVTDNLIQSATNADFSPATTDDLGSAATSATVTGLTPGTLYYFQVAAKNTSGTGTYSQWVVAYTGAVGTVTLSLPPIAVDNASSVTNTGGAASLPAALSDGSDATYAAFGPTISNVLAVLIRAVPSNLIWVTGITLNLRMKSTNGSYLSPPSWSLTIGGNKNAAVLFPSLSNVTTSFANYSVSVSGLDQQANNSGITQALSDWNNVDAAGITAILGLSEADANGVLQISEANVTVTYWAGMGTFGLAPPATIVNRGAIIAANYW